MYGEQEREGTKLKTTLSRTNVGYVTMGMISWCLVYPKIIIEQICPKLDKDLMSNLEKSKFDIDTYFKINSSELKEFRNMIANVSRSRFGL